MPVGSLLRELILALGAALALANVAVVLKERRRDEDDRGPRPNMKLVTVNIVIGTVLAAWGLASIIAAR